MAKRELFDELMQGFDELKAERGGKITLKTTEVEMPEPIKMSATKIANIRKAHRYSQAVFARILATNVSTLRNWEQGRSDPNAQAKLLLKMVENDGEILRQMAELTTGRAEVKAKHTARKKTAPKKKAPVRTAAKRKAGAHRTKNAA